MNPQLRPIADLLATDRIQYRIPLFQRNYAWEKKRVELFLRYACELSEARPSDETNFIGFMVTEPASNGSDLQIRKYNVIDGQQRLTTFSLILIASRKIADEQVALITKACAAPSLAAGKRAALENIAEFYREQIKELGYKYLENRWDQSDLFIDKLKFVPQGVNRDTFRKIYTQEDLTGVTDEDTLKVAYLTIVKELRGHLQTEGKIVAKEKFLSFIAAIQSLKVVQLELTSSDDPQKIFETINDRGKPLSPVDLIRNQVFKDEDDAVVFHRDYWEPVEKNFHALSGALSDEDAAQAAEPILYDYVRCLLMRNGDYLEKKRVHHFFRQNYNTSDEKIRFLISLEKLCSKYVTLTHPDSPLIDRTSPESLLKEIRRLQGLDFQAANPLLLRLLEDGVDNRQLESVIRLLESYFIRRSICGDKVQLLPKIFIKLCKEYNDNFPAGMDVHKWLKGELLNDRDLEPKEQTYKYPTDTDVLRSLRTTNLYDKNTSVTKYLLLRLNEHKMGKEYPGEVADCTIEHVMPQTLSESWVNYLNLPKNDLKVMHEEHIGLIGNLALTKVNPALGNKLFADKKPLLAMSPYILTNALGNSPSNEWNKELIMSRTEDLGALTLVIFPDLKTEE
jgi:uncharacterized protein with ParB-like and HNH nuclease domain